MHCSPMSARTATSRRFFRASSGTGKDPRSRPTPRAPLIVVRRSMVGKDGIFNFEGGCYAKAIKLSREAEPESTPPPSVFGSVMENVVIDPVTVFRISTMARRPRIPASPIRMHFIANASETGRAGIRKHRDADRRCLRRHAAHRQADPSRGDVPLPVGLHRQGRRHREGRHRAAADLLDVLRRPFMPRPPSEYGNLLRELIASTMSTAGW